MIVFNQMTRPAELSQVGLEVSARAIRVEPNFRASLQLDLYLSDSRSPYTLWSEVREVA